MKTLVIGLDCATPELLLGDERLTNIRRLMENGSYGKLETVIPPLAVPAWMCMAASEDPGSLGVYGLRNRNDHSYGDPGAVDSGSIQALTIWDQVGAEQKRCNVIGVPPSFPPLRVNGNCVSCFLTPGTSAGSYTYPDSLKGEIETLIGGYPFDVHGIRGSNKDRLKDEIFSMSRKHFEVVRHLMRESKWDYFHFVEMGLDRLQHGFWKYHDPEHLMHEPGNPYRDVVSDYYLYLDHEIGTLLELLDEDTAILVLSDHGAQRLDGGFCINEWLIEEGLLVLNRYPDQVTPLSSLDVDWEKTRAWSEGGYYAGVFINVRGREPNGNIHQAEYERFRDELKTRIESIPDHVGRPMGNLAYKPEEIYETVRNVAPDLMVHSGGLHWRSIGEVGHCSRYVREGDTLDDCSHSQFGSFILASSNSPLQGEVEGAHILDLAPTLLELGGYDLPTSMQGRSLVSGKALTGPSDGYTEDVEELVRERLSGLGYIS